jgi:hypothetical protein
MTSKLRFTFACAFVLFALTLVPFFGTGAAAQIGEPGIEQPSDYQVCMDYCMGDGHGFVWCHSQCKDMNQ